MSVSTLSAPNPIKDIYKKLVFFDINHVENAYEFMYTDNSTLFDTAITQVDNAFVLTKTLTLKSTLKMSDTIPGGAQGSADNNPINIGQLHNDIYGITTLQSLEDDYAPKHQTEVDWDVTGKGLMEIDHLEFEARVAKDNEQDYEFDKIQRALYGSEYDVTEYRTGGVADDAGNPYTFATNGWAPTSGFIVNNPTNLANAASTTMLAADAALDKEVQHNRTWIQTAWNYLQGTDGGGAPSHPGGANGTNPSNFDGSEWAGDGYYISDSSQGSVPARPGGAVGPDYTTSMYDAMVHLDAESRANETWLNATNKWIDSSDVDNTDQSLAWVAPTDNWGEFSAIVPTSGLTYTKDAIAGTASIDAMDAIKHLDMNMRHLRYLIDRNVDNTTTDIDDAGSADWIENPNRLSLAQLRTDMDYLKTSWDGTGNTTGGALSYASTVGDVYSTQNTLHGDITQINNQLEFVTSMLTGATTAGNVYSTSVSGSGTNAEADIEELYDLSVTDAWSHKNRLDQIVVHDTGKLVNATDDYFDMDGYRIKNVQDPADLFDVANKGWVEGQIAGTAQGHGVQVCTYRLGDSAALQIAAGANIAPGGGIMAVDTSVGQNWANKGVRTLDGVDYNHGGIYLHASDYTPVTEDTSGVYIDGHLMVEGDLVLLTEEGATTEDGVSDSTGTNHWSSGHSPDNEDWHWRNGIWVFHYDAAWTRPSAGSALWGAGNSMAQGLIHAVEFGKDAGDNDVIWAFWTIQPETTFTYGTNTKICETKAQADAAIAEGTPKNPRNAWAVFTGLQAFNAGNVTTIQAGNTVQVTLDAESVIAAGVSGETPPDGVTLTVKLSATGNADGVLQKGANGIGLNYDASDFVNTAGVLNLLTSRADTVATLAATTSIDTVALTVTGAANFSGADIVFDTDTLYVDVDANKVGIGTSSPNSLLELSDATDTSLRLHREEAGEGSIVDGDILGSIWFAGRDGTAAGTSNNGALIRAEAAGTWGTATLANDCPTELKFYTNSDGAVNSLLAPRMTIATDGNIGIGTETTYTPYSPLHIVGAGEGEVSDGTGIPQLLVQGTGLDGTKVGPIICLHNSSSYQTDNEWIGSIAFTGGDSSDDFPTYPDEATQFAAISARIVQEFQPDAAGSLNFFVESENVLVNAMTIVGDSSISKGPFVGIGTTTPDRLLHVHTQSGGIQIGELNVGGNSFGEITYEHDGGVDSIGLLDIKATKSGTGGATIALNRLGGNVGIGTATPGSELDLGGGYMANEQGRQDHIANTMAAPYYYFDGTGDYAQIGNVDLAGNIDFGTGDFSIIVQASVHSNINYDCLVGRANNWGSSDTGWILGIYDNKLAFNASDGDTDYQTNFANSSTIINDGAINHLAVTVTKNTFLDADIYGYVNGVQEGDRRDLTFGDDGDTDFALDLELMRNTDNMLNGSLYRVIIFNCALTAAEVKEFSSGGSIPWKYKGANQTELAIANASFEDDTSSPPGSVGWSNAGNHTGTATADGSAPSGSNSCVVVSSGVGSTTNTFYYDGYVAALIVGKKYRVGFYAKSDSGNTDMTFYPEYTTLGAAAQESITLTGSWVFHQFDFIIDSIASSGHMKWWIGGAGTFRIDAIKLRQIGAVLEYDGSGMTSTAWYDKSGNNKDLTIAQPTGAILASQEGIGPIRFGKNYGADVEISGYSGDNYTPPFETTGSLMVAGKGFYKGARYITSSLIEAWAMIGYLSPGSESLTGDSGMPMHAKITVYAHHDGCLIHNAFEVVTTYYTGGDTDWIPCRAISQQTWQDNTSPTIWVDARFASSGGALQLRIRRQAASSGAGWVRFTLETDCEATFVSESNEGESATYTGDGVQGMLGYQFPATISAFEATKKGMFINSLGYVGIGIDEPLYSLHIAEAKAAGYAAFFGNGADTSDSYGILVQCGQQAGDGRTEWFRANEADGDATGYLETNSGVFSLEDTSDIRLKKDVTDTAIEGLSCINDMKVRDFTLKKNNCRISAGFIANELQEVFPPAAHGEPDAMEDIKDGDGNVTGERIKAMTVSRERLVPVMVKAIQELSDKVDGKEVISYTRREKIIPAEPPVDWQTIAMALDLRLKAVEKELNK